MTQRSRRFRICFRLPRNPVRRLCRDRRVGAHGAADSASRLRRPQDTPRVEELKRDAIADVDARREFTQQMVDQVFSFGELGFQEFETSKYLTGILEKNGFKDQSGIAGMPTAWVATWGSASR